MDDLKGDKQGQNHGIVIAKRAMEALLREIVSNAGEEPFINFSKRTDGTAARAACDGLPGRVDIRFTRS